MRLKPKDYIVSADIISDDNTLLVVGENGYGKRTALSEYRVQGRGGSGILTMNVTSKTGEIVSAEVVAPDDRLLIMTTQGKAIRTPVKDIRLVGRVAQGVKLINLAQGDTVRSIARLIRSADEGDFDDIEEPEGVDEGSEELEE